MNQTNTTGPYPSDRTAILLVDPYNDFLSEGGKLWPRVSELATRTNLLANMHAVVRHQPLRHYPEARAPAASCGSAATGHGATWPRVGRRPQHQYPELSALYITDFIARTAK